ncbi:MAG: hypothetical protein ACRDRG_13530 [Pseudonocardiaceae bacterium]
MQATGPFDWPGSGHHHHGDADDHAIAIMLEVLEIVRKPKSERYVPDWLPIGDRALLSV